MRKETSKEEMNYNKIPWWAFILEWKITGMILSLIMRAIHKYGKADE